MPASWGFAFVVSDWLIPVAVLVGAALLGWIVSRIVFAIARRLAKRRLEPLIRTLSQHLKAPLAWALPLVGVAAALATVDIPPHVSGLLSHVTALLLIAAAAWIAVRLIDVLGDVLAARYVSEGADSLRARKVQTKFTVLRGIGAALITLIALGLMLLTFPGVRVLGAAVFASAGAAGIVLGIAAKPVLGNLLAGVQIALAQPIRLEDAVVVEGESGWVEEITMTYVVVRIWDQRRLVLPLSYFIENPFQSWTRHGTDLLGTVFIYADYAVPVEALRAELFRILQASKLWDRKAWSLVVTELTERVVQLRATVSAANSGSLFDLRCLVREQLVLFLQRNYPASLPRTRVVTDTTPQKLVTGSVADKA